MSEAETQKKNFTKAFLFDVLRGCAIGVAFIIPGFSGGSIAAILGIYEKLVGAIADIFKDFKKNILTLLPIGIGMVIGVISLLFPLGWALERFPFPTVCLFVGLTIGGLPSVTDKLSGKIKPANIAAFSMPLVLALTLSFLPTGNDVNLFNLTLGGYILLVVIGLIGSAALVIPGISGSMLLLIFGYYNPIINMVTDHLFRFKDVGVSILVLGLIALGIAVGFFLISVIMKWLLKNCKRGTYFAIFGFIVGSIPTVYISTAKESGYTLSTLPTSAFHWIMCVVMLVFGFFLSFSLVKFSKRTNK
ncbi:MAG: DUF368 domain-containing protein [Ruminococcaceae bacterium]|nr:DUF368 domain-containing protein [Oscillospiraceae bacterium]